MKDVTNMLFKNKYSYDVNVPNAFFIQKGLNDQPNANKNKSSTVI